MKKTTIYLEEDQLLQIKDIATREQRSEADVIREALAEYMVTRRPKKLSFIGIVSDGTFPAAKDEEYLKEHWKPDW